MSSALRFSIVTPTYRQGEYIEQTIQSVLSQQYPALEYIVVDGGSRDNTLDVLRRFDDALIWTSEPDEGQADAVNKGFARSTGDILGWINSDDYYAPGAFQAVAAVFEAHPEVAFVYGDAIGIDEAGHEYGVRTHVYARQSYQLTDLDVLVHHYDFIVQPACFWRASLWRELGELDTSLQYTLDYEYWMRVAAHTSLYYLPSNLAFERLYTRTKTGAGAIHRIQEIEAVARRHGGAGLPQRYRDEGAARYLVRFMQQVLHKKWNDAKADYRQATALCSSTGRVLGFVLVFTVLGQDALPVVWLWLNRLRVFAKRFRK